ncbi:MAG: xanthine dehydrogenase family protein molybdopterin-binding subunit [Chloroflexi bacterium]|nr:xanthine dehydrogenase family protein molybdopterin-binding subunit [Chloroflexota bacterium]
MATTEYARNVVLSSKEYDVVGTRPVRPDGADKVTGRALYGADFNASGLLHGKVLRSPHAHARIKSIDTSKAEAHAGVLAVVTNKDLPSGVDGGVRDLQRNVLAADKALYRGHAVAAVAATSPHEAEEAIALIEVDYEVLPAVLTVQEAMAEGASILHDDLRTDEGGVKGDKPTNVAEHFRHDLGDIEKGFAESDVIVEREFNTATVHQGYIEPQVASALWNTDGRVHVWCSTQGAFPVRDEVSRVLGISESRVRVTPMEIGGGFGGKIPSYIEPVCAVLSKKAGRPVKIVMTRREVFEGTGPTSGSHIKIKVGADNQGNIKAAHAYLAYEAGGFKGSPVGAASQCVFAAYAIPNQAIDGHDVVVNKPKTQAYRAPGATNAAFAMETVVSELAEKLGIDPIDIRLRNVPKEGTRRAHGPAFPRIGCEEVLQAMKDHPHYSAPLDGPNQGRGVSIGYWFNVGFKSACTISVNPDGTISLIEGSTDIGGSRASISMQAAEVLGIRAEDVHPTVVDTDSVGYTDVTGGSRTTYATGWAAYNAAEDVKKQMIERAALIWDVDADSLEMVKGVTRSKTDSELKMTFKELAAELNNTGGTIIGSGSLDAGGLGTGGGSFAGNIVDVEVDPETGKVSILRFTAVQDAGKAIHPSYVEGQMQGGSVQGIGWALNEEYYMSDDGTMTNSSLLDYRMPTSLDLPMIDTVIVEVPSPSHPFGVRGVGEANIVPPPAAVAHAIHNATGVWMDRLPMNPAAVMKANWSK